MVRLGWMVPVLMAMLVLGGPTALAQGPASEPGTGAASLLPEASALGEGWTRDDVVSPNALAGDEFEMSPDLFREGAAGLYAGPDGARAIVVNLIVTDSRVAVRASWDGASELVDHLTESVDIDSQLTDALKTLAPPAPCAEAKRFEGTERGYLTRVGVTICAQDPDHVWIVLVSGTLNGAIGAMASDALIASVLGGGIAATPAAPVEPAATPAALFDGIPTDGRFLGSEEAPVRFVVYEDFQCPFCKQFNDAVFPSIVETFVRSGDVRVEWRAMPIIGDYAGIPLDSPANESVQAAEAAMCAADQDRFWPYAEALYAAQGAENSGVFSDDMLTRTAADLDLDLDAFTACLASGEKQDEVIGMRTAGLDNGVRATPSFFIDDQLVAYTAEGYSRLEVQLRDAVEGRPVQD